MSVEISHRGQTRSDAAFAGRVNVLYTLGRHYLSLTFAVLSIPATLVGGRGLSVLPIMPLLLQIVAVCATEQLITAYKNRPPGSDPHYWARRYTFVSLITGATWGISVPFWFVWNSFPAEAYLAVAFLGMMATEFIVRSAHRPAYIAHACCSLGPLLVMLLVQGDLYAISTAVLVGCFGVVLISYSKGMGRLLEESVCLIKAEETARLAQEESRAKSTFIGTISHELRTPLHGILGFSEILRQKVHGPLGSPQYDDYAANIHSSGSWLLGTVNDVIEISRIEGGKIELHRVRTEVTSLASEAILLMTEKAAAKNIELILLGTETLVECDTCPKSLREILLRLIDNAVKFSPYNSIVEIDVSAQGQELRIQIRDSGIGIHPEDIAKLGRPFVQAESHLGRNHGGIGLGLAICYGLVRALDGTIKVVSQLGSGTTVSLRLPRSDVTATHRPFAA